MQRLLALALVALALAGCTAPPPEAAPSGGAEPSDAQLQRALEAARAVEGEAAPTPSPTQAPAPAKPPSEAPRGAPPQDYDAPPLWGDAGADGVNTPAGDATAAPAPTPAEAPVWRVGDTWSLRGVDLAGNAFNEVQTVAALGTAAGAAVYVLNDTLGDASHVLNVTRSGLDLVNETGYVTELLRFPLRAGANWTFGWDRADDVVWGNETHTLRQFLHADVQVLGLEKAPTALRPFDAWHVRAKFATGTASRATHMTLDYWYAPEAKNLVRLETRSEDGRSSWSELTGFQLR